jgi:hypothetical protein
MRPAVRDLTLASAVNVAIALGATVALAFTGQAGVIPLVAVLLVLLFGIGAPFFVRRQASMILAEAGEDDHATPRGGLGAPVIVNVVLLLALLGFALAIDGLNPGLTGGLVGVSLWWLGVAWRLRRWEIETGRMLLYRPVYRWEGTGGRVWGRGWFDPANFVSAPRS